MIFELGVILPRVLAIRKALNFGIPQKFLNKKLKKDLGATDYRIWEKHDILNQKMEFLEDDGQTIDEAKVKEMLDNSEFFNFKHLKNRAEDLVSLKEMFDDNLIPIIRISLEEGSDSGKNEAIGK